MILLPLGFGRKLPTFPWITVGLAASILLISIPYFSSVKEIESIQAQAIKATSYGPRLQKFADIDCAAEGFEIEDCATLTKAIKAQFGLEKKGVGTSVKTEKNAESDDEAKRYRKLINEKGFSRGIAEIAKSNQRLTEYAKILFGDPGLFSARMQATAGYEELVEAQRELQKQLDAEYKNVSALSRSNQGLKQLMLAQWTHMGWMHLLGNLFVFLALAPVLEARMGKLAFLGLYLLGGTIGLLVELYAVKDMHGILLGASANISAVIGGFFVFFFYRPMKVLASLIIYNRLLDCPTWLMIPVLFLLGDISGALGNASSTAHLAHLTGFAIGACMAYYMKQNDGLHAAYIYPIEYDWHLELRSAKTLAEKIQLADLVLKYNPENYLVEKDVVEISLAVVREFPSRPNLEARGFLADRFSHAVKSAMLRNNQEETKLFISDFPLQLCLIECLTGLPQLDLIKLGDSLLKDGEWLTALRVYDAFRFHYPKTSGGNQMEQTMTKVLDHLQTKGADLSTLTIYHSIEPATTFENLISQFTPAFTGDAYESAS